MKPLVEHLYAMAMHPHMTGDAFRMAVVLAYECHDLANRETFDQAFQRYAQSAIFDYERRHFTGGKTHRELEPGQPSTGVNPTAIPDGNQHEECFDGQTSA